MAVNDRWHKKRRGPDGKVCKEHGLPPSKDHGKGGRWQVRWRDETGQQRAQTFDKKTGKDPQVHADAFDAKVQGELAAGSFVDPRGGRTPFGEYAKTWAEARLLKPTSDETYWQRLRRHILPAFESMPIGSIRPTTVQQWVKKLRASGLAPSTIGNIYIIFASIMRGAVRDDLIRKSPCRDITLPDIPETAIVVLEPKQVVALALAVRAVAPRYEVLVWEGAGLGLRQGEAFGLAKSRVKFLKRLVEVDQQVIRVKSKAVLAPVKTKASRRPVPLPEYVSRAIARHIEKFGPDDVLCVTARGNLVNRGWFNDDVWKPAVKAAGLPEDLTFHDLRHTFASQALARGVPISDVSKWLGHKSITETVDTYGHLVPDADHRIRNVIDEVFREALAGEDAEGETGEGEGQ